MCERLMLGDLSALRVRRVRSHTRLYYPRSMFLHHMCVACRREHWSCTTHESVLLRARCLKKHLQTVHATCPCRPLTSQMRIVDLTRVLQQTVSCSCSTNLWQTFMLQL